MNDRFLFKSTMQTAIFMVSVVAVLNVLFYLITGDFKFRYTTPFILVILSLYIGFIYSKLYSKLPSFGFRMQVTLYYLIFSRLWLLCMSLVFIDKFYLMDFSTYQITSLVLAAIGALLLNYLIVYHFINLGSKVYFLTNKHLRVHKSYS